MKSKFKAINPDEIEMELTISMSLKDWVELRGQVAKQGHPAWKLIMVITEMVAYANQHFYPKENDESNSTQ